MKDRFEPSAPRWQPPPELGRSRPRPVRLTVLGRLAVLLIALLLAGAAASGIVLAALAARDQARRELLERQASHPAEVIELGRRRGEKNRFYAVYRYSVQGVTYQGRANFRRTEWEGLKVGSALRIRLLASQPETSWLEDRLPGGVAWWVVPLAPAGLLFCIWPLVYYLRKQARLLSEGRPALARVTGSKRFSTGHTSGHRVQYQFQILSGAIRTGRYDTTKKPPAIGETLVILYDADEASRQARYPLSLVRTL